MRRMSRRPPRSGVLLPASLAAVLVLVSASSGPCEDLLRCCDSLATNNPTLGSQCRASYDEYHGREGAAQACADALSSLAATGACETSSDGGTRPDGAGDGGPPGGHEVCDAYLT